VPHSRQAEQLRLQSAHAPCLFEFSQARKLANYFSALSQVCEAMSLQRAAMAHRLKLGGAAVVAAAIALRMARRGKGERKKKGKGEGGSEERVYDPNKSGVAVSECV
jgi:hypothetical protein